MKNIIFIAPPAAGKGTQSKLLSEKYNIPHISTGDLLRDEINKKTQLGNSIKKDMEQGNLITDEVVLSLLEQRLIEKDCKDGYILDGYPRNVKQAIAYDALINKMNKDLGVVIFLDIDKDLALERTISRVICPKCGASYNLLIEDVKPKTEGICDRCSSKLNTRSDDNKETFLKRFDTYLEKTSDLINYYQDKKVLKIIKVTKDNSAMDIFEEIEGILKK